jgi:hypothetical protein
VTGSRSVAWRLRGNPWGFGCSRGGLCRELSSRKYLTINTLELLKRCGRDRRVISDDRLCGPRSSQPSTVERQPHGQSLQGKDRVCKGILGVDSTTCVNQPTDPKKKGPGIHCEPSFSASSPSPFTSHTAEFSYRSSAISTRPTR